MTATREDPAVDQAALLEFIPEGALPDCYIVIPVEVLARQLKIDWGQVAKDHRGEVRLGWLMTRHLRSIMGLGHIVDTKRIGPTR